MMASAQIVEVNHPIAERLRELGITEVAIIDDAYDPPTVDSLQSGEIDDFWGEVDRNPGLLQELHTYKDAVEAAEDIDNEVLMLLWTNLDNLKHLKDPCEKLLFPNKLQMSYEISLISENLTELGLNIVPVTSAQLPDPSVKLIFLDYVLDPTYVRVIDDGEKIGGVGEMATQKAMEIYEQAKKENTDKPFIVLMSSKEGVETQANDFRDTSGLLGALFGFMRKEDLCDREKLSLRLGSWGIGNPTHHEIQRFVDTALESLDTTSDKFKKVLKGLDIQDYTFIQRLSLHEDGQPLGDYMLWLFESTLSYIFRDNSEIRARQNSLDKMKFDKFLPCQNQPSLQLARTYRFALTEPAAGELRAHPHDEGNGLPLFRLGDIFIKDASSDILMVINATCDLTFSPAASRQCDPAQPIYLIPGSLEPMHSRRREAELLRTELFEYEGKAFRIVWNYKSSVTKEYKEVWNWLSEQGYSLEARLRLAYALQVQQHFAAHLSRIGMPVPPPIYDKADIEVYCKGDDGNYSMVGDTIKDGVVIIHGSKSDQFVLTVEGVSTLLDKVEVVIERIKKRKDSLNREDKHYKNKAKAVMREAEKVKEYKAKSQTWLKLVENPMSLPKVEAKEVFDEKLLWVYRDCKLEGKYKPNVPITLNIRYKENPSEQPSSGGVNSNSGIDCAAAPAESSKACTISVPAQSKGTLGRLLSKVHGWLQRQRL